jgi:hypothetical protein
MKKNNKINKLRTTTALTLLTAITFFAQTHAIVATTSNNSLTPVASVAKVCTIAATAMTFTAYLELELTQTTTLTATCTNGTTGTISIADATDGPDAGSYKLIRATTNGAATENYLKITFKKTSNNDAMYSGAANGTLSHVGTGSAVTTDLGITGTIDAGQTSRTAGTFSKVVTLNITYAG